MRSQYTSPFVRVLLLLVGSASLWACSFSEGPDWPAPADPAETRRQSVQSLPEGTSGEDRASLADFAGGEPLAPPQGGGATLVGRVVPLAVIRFGAAPVDFEPAIYDAMRDALQRRPATAFDLVAVTPYVGGAQQAAFAGHLERVFRVLLGMGLPAERLSLSALSLPGPPTDEVHVYAR
jgi:hypothetical protein